MTLPTNEFRGSDERRRVARANRIFDTLARMDAVTVVVIRAVWHAVIEGLAAYGMTQCNLIMDLELYQAANPRYERDTVPASWTESRMTYFGDMLESGYLDEDEDVQVFIPGAGPGMSVGAASVHGDGQRAARPGLGEQP
jgi:hypothetical protein